jgi:hypothetical protein
MTAGTGSPGGAAMWPEVAWQRRVVWPVVLWRATSEHPDIGAIRGRGLSRAGALRAATRQVRRSAPGAPPGGGPPMGGSGIHPSAPTSLSGP